MKNYQIFDKAREIVKTGIYHGGKSKHKTEFVGGGDLSGDIYFDTSKYKYKKNKLKIEYSDEHFEDKSRRTEEIHISEKGPKLFSSWNGIYEGCKSNKDRDKKTKKSVERFRERLYCERKALINRLEETMLKMKEIDNPFLTHRTI